MTRLRSADKRRQSTKNGSLPEPFKASFKASFKAPFKAATVKATPATDDSATAAVHEILSSTSALSSYPISWNVFWKGKNIDSGIKTSDKFSYQDFNVIGVKMMKQKIDAKRIYVSDAVQIQCSAKISAVCMRRSSCSRSCSTRRRIDPATR